MDKATFLRTVGRAVGLGLGLALLNSLFALGSDAAEVFAKNEAGFLVNVDEHNVILGGHDAVAYFTQSKPVLGSSDYQAIYQGATYHFESAANRDAFVASPERYAPQFGGFCAMAAALGKVEPGDPEHFLIVDDRLLLQRNAKAAGMFKKRPKRNLAKADRKWPKLVRRAPGPS